MNVAEMGLRLFYNLPTISSVLQQVIPTYVYLGRKLRHPAQMASTGNLVSMTTAPC